MQPDSNGLDALALEYRPEYGSARATLDILDLINSVVNVDAPRLAERAG